MDTAQVAYCLYLALVCRARAPLDLNKPVLTITLCQNVWVWPRTSQSSPCPVPGARYLFCTKWCTAAPVLLCRTFELHATYVTYAYQVQKRGNHVYWCLLTSMYTKCSISGSCHALYLVPPLSKGTTVADTYPLPGTYSSVQYLIDI